MNQFPHQDHQTQGPNRVLRYVQPVFPGFPETNFEHDSKAQKLFGESFWMLDEIACRQVIVEAPLPEGQHAMIVPPKFDVHNRDTIEPWEVTVNGNGENETKQSALLWAHPTTETDNGNVNHIFTAKILGHNTLEEPADARQLHKIAEVVDSVSRQWKAEPPESVYGGREGLPAAIWKAIRQRRSRI